MRNDPTILQSAMAGYLGQPVQGMFSSPVWLGHVAGEAVAKKGGSEPVRACTSRGYSVRVATAGGAEYLVKFSGDALDQIDVVTN